MSSPEALSQLLSSGILSKCITASVTIKIIRKFETTGGRSYFKASHRKAWGSLIKSALIFASQPSHSERILAVF